MCRHCRFEPNWSQPASANCKNQGIYGVPPGAVPLLKFLPKLRKNAVDNRKKRGKIPLVYCETAMTKSVAMTAQSEERMVQALREPNCSSRFRVGL